MLLQVSVCPQGEGVHPLGKHPPGKVSPGRHPPPRDGHCSGWYVSYWNAFLFLKFFYQCISPFRGATDIPVLDFWRRLAWVSKPVWIPCLSASSPAHKEIQIHLWCDTCWSLTSQHGSWAVSIHILAHVQHVRRCGAWVFDLCLTRREVDLILFLPCHSDPYRNTACVTGQRRQRKNLRGV